MCGIVGFTGKQSAAPVLLAGLKKLEYRGYDHFMLKEIMEQPRAVEAALTPRLQEEQIHLDGFDYSPES